MNFKTLFLLTGLIYSQTLLADNLIQISPQQIKSLNINIAKPIAVQQKVSTPFTGKISVPQTQIKVISSPALGLIKSLNYSLEDTVKKGATLGSIQSADLIASQGGYLQNQAKLQNAKRNVDRDAQLLKEGIISQRRYEESVALYKELSAINQEKVQMMRLHGVSPSKNGISGGSSLISPIEGVIIEQNAQVGQRVDATTVIYKIAKLNPLWAELQVPFKIAQNLSLGDFIQIQSHAVSGKIILISKNINPTNQTVLVRAELKEIKDLKPNQQIEATIQSGLSQPQFLIANSAIAYKGKEAFIFVQRKNGFEPIPVQVISQNQQGITISGKISATDLIAIKGVSAIKGSWLGFGGGEE